MRRVAEFGSLGGSEIFADTNAPLTVSIKGMKSKLTILFVGFAAGVLVTFLAFGLTDSPPSGSRTRTMLGFEFQTNGSGPVVMKRVVR